MTTEAPPLDLRRLNSCSVEEFADLLDGIFEDARPLVVRAAELRPFSDVAALHTALVMQVEALPEDELVAFLSSHPELAGQQARTGTMTVSSTREQALLNLGQLPEAETRRWNVLNAHYRERFGFPFIVRVAEHDYASLLAVFGRRLENERAEELRIATSEVAKISRQRLATRLGGLV